MKIAVVNTKVILVGGNENKSAHLQNTAIFQSTASNRTYLVLEEREESTMHIHFNEA